ncbi:MAG: thioredoxin family protein [Acidimicrobiales bacterium]
MAATPSTMLALGTPAPAFDLPDPAGVHHTLDSVAGDAPVLVVVFLSNHCPYVKHIGRELGLVTQRLLARGVAVVGIMSNDVEAYPDDAPPLMATTARSYGWDFPYLYDETQDVARSYSAACTPDFFVFDAERRLAYRGQFDGARPSNDVAVTGTDLKAAVDALLAGGTPTADQLPSLGCNVKWRA